uniref:Solute carrier family 12 member 9 n=1 Tax=Timema bartmani TaxID=61472 RepID=A0A7R9HVI5_9NEOP|nr:unnamed protein product [Timema bartmani]
MVELALLADMVELALLAVMVELALLADMVELALLADMVELALLTEMVELALLADMVELALLTEMMRCLLNIWGVMLFLRLSWVIGQAGVGEGVAVICLANLVTLLTTISMSAVCTNGQIKGGGIYYMISRSLGPEFGGAIGLMFTLANSIAVSMYIVGFCESLQDLLRTFGITLIDGSTNDIRVVGIGTLVGILVLAMVGMDWVTRTQMVLLIVLIASQVDFVVGSIMGPKSDLEKAKGFVGYNMETFSSNIWSDYREFEGVEHSFFSVFSVFFPAVTGIVAGANLSGDLKDPSSAIPIGTLLAILVTFLSYVGYAFMMGGCVLRDASGNVTEYLRAVAENPENPWAIIANCTDRSCRFGLENDNQAMELVSSWGPLIYGGCFAATLSSAIASLVGAPRVLQKCIPDAESRHDDRLSSRLSYRRGPPRHTVPDWPQLVLSRGRNPLLVPGEVLIYPGDWVSGSLCEGFVDVFDAFFRVIFSAVPRWSFFKALVGIAFAALPVLPLIPTSGVPEAGLSGSTTAARNFGPRGRLPEVGSGESSVVQVGEETFLAVSPLEPGSELPAGFGSTVPVNSKLSAATKESAMPYVGDNLHSTRIVDPG